MSNEDLPGGEVGPQLRTLERGLQILSLFDVEHQEWTFGEVCRASGLSKATAFRFLKKMEAMRYLGYDEQTRTYHLGSSLLAAAYLASAHSQIARIARPLLEELAAATGEAVNIALGTDEGPLIVDAVYAPTAFRPHLHVGVVLRGLTAAHTRVFAAYASEEERLKLLLGEQEKRTEHTITDPQTLAGILAKVKEEGICYSQEEWFIGSCAAAVPVFDCTGTVRQSVAIIAPKERFRPEDQLRYGEALHRTAAELSLELGGASRGLQR